MFDYQGARWKRKREKILRIDGYTDVWAKRYGKMLPANTVHHIYPAKDYPEYAWEDWNLISVSLATHNKLEDRNNGELTDEGMKLMKRTIPGVDWREKAWSTAARK